jgi:hypothetical protein
LGNSIRSLNRTRKHHARSSDQRDGAARKTSTNFHDNPVSRRTAGSRHYVSIYPGVAPGSACNVVALLETFRDPALDNREAGYRFDLQVTRGPPDMTSISFPPGVAAGFPVG